VLAKNWRLCTQLAASACKKCFVLEFVSDWKIFSSVSIVFSFDGTAFSFVINVFTLVSTVFAFVNTVFTFVSTVLTLVSRKYFSETLRKSKNEF
jgi:hypothetical protein